MSSNPSGGGWVGGLQGHNDATSWPNLKDGTCKNSIKIEFQVGPKCGNMSYISLNFFIEKNKEFNFA